MLLLFLVIIITRYHLENNIISEDKIDNKAFNSSSEHVDESAYRSQLIEAINRTSAQKMNANSTSMNWIERGPSNVGGRTRSFIFDQSDPTNNSAFAGGVTGGLWKTTNLLDANSIWQPIGDFWANIKVSSIVQDPNNSSILYVGTGETWTATTGFGMGIWKSIDHGQTWNQLTSTDNSDFTYVHRLLFDTQGNLYACTKNAGIQKSNDDGLAWTKVLGIGSNSSTDIAGDIELGPDGDLFASMGGWLEKDSVYISNNSIHGTNTGNASTWTAIPLPLDLSRIELACAESNPNVIYAVGAQNGIQVDGLYRSNDKGLTWNSLNLPTINPTLLLGQANYNLCIEVDPKRDSTVVFGAVGFFRSTDAGTSWTYTLIGHADQHELVFMPTNATYSDTVMVCNDGGIYMGKTVNSNPIVVQYSSKNNGYNVTQCYGGAIHPDSNSDYITAGTQDTGPFYLSNPNFGVATHLFSPNSPQFHGDFGFAFIDETNTDIQIIAQKSNVFYFTTDNWQTHDWHVFSGGAFINRMDYDQESQIMYSYHSTGKYLRWNDPTTGGNSTDEVDLVGVNGFLSSIKASPNITNTVYFASNNGTISRVSDAHIGTTKNVDIIYQGPSLYVSSIEIEEGNENHIIITYNNYDTPQVLETWNSLDPSPTWTEINGDLPNMPVKWALLNPTANNECMLATETGIWYTENINGSTNWVASNDFPSVRTDMLRLRKSDNTVAAFTYGRGVFTTDYFNEDCSSVLNLTGTPVQDKVYSALDTINSESTINAPLNIKYHSEGVINLNPGFSTSLNATFEAKITECID